MLFLEEVSANGFKSYAEEVTVNFNPGIGVIIGNNGVGKSNILDAITWALGEESLKKLRCYAVKDLLYFGGKDHPPADCARVRLRFKQGTGKEAESVTVSRELLRSGEERYRINDDLTDVRSYRLKLYELGLGDALKTLVRQEQLNDILEMSPEDRYEHFFRFTGVSPGDPSTEQRLLKLAEEFRFLLRGLMPEGGDARLYVEQFNGSPGIEIEILFRDKGSKLARFISGGEKTVASLALKLSLFNQLQSPFYLLDEVEPSLDWTNHRNMSNVLRTLAQKRQLIMITHLRSTVEVADTVHGVRTHFDGSSWMKFHFVMDKRLLRLYKCC